MLRTWRRLNAQPVYVQLLVAAVVVIVCSALISAVRSNVTQVYVSPAATAPSTYLSIGISTDSLVATEVPTSTNGSAGSTTATTTMTVTTLAVTTTITVATSAAATSTPAPATAVLTTPATTAATVPNAFGLQVVADHIGGYDRSLFPTWIDADHNGCDTRQEVLIAESIVTPTIGASCAVSGEWRSAYDGVDTVDASKFDIDHMVPLAEAWASGAWSWTAAQRSAYANDLDQPYFLVAVSAASNRSKGDRDPAEWLPPSASFRCTYVLDWVAVKRAWSLTVDPAEAAAIQGLLNGC